MSRNSDGYQSGFRVLKILVADDDARIRALIVDLLRPLGHEVIEASSGQDAVSAMEKHSPRLVLVDLQMPGGGVNGIRQIIAVDESVRCVVITGEVGQTAERILRNLGMVILTKPLAISDVVAVVGGAEQAS